MLKDIIFNKLTKDGQSAEDYLAGVLGEPYVGYRKKFKTAGVGAFRMPDFPLQLDFQLNNRCNYRCPMCFWSEPRKLQDWSYPSTEFPFNKFCSIVRQGREKGNLKVINFEGLNEPLLKNDLVKYISFAKDAGVVDLTLHTNGLLLDKKWAARLVKSGLTQLMISLDAFSRETYYKVRRSKKYDTVVRNISSFLEIRAKMKAKLPLLRLSFVVQPSNIQERKDFVKYWKKYADYILIQELIDMTKIANENEYRPSKGKFCPQPFYRMSIKANGEVFPCCCSLGHIYLSSGNVFKDKISVLWKGELFERIRRMIKDGKYHEIPACKICFDNIFST